MPSCLSLADGGPIGDRITVDHTRSRSLLPALLAFRLSRMPITVDRSPDRRSRNGEDVKDGALLPRTTRRGADGPWLVRRVVV